MFVCVIASLFLVWLQFNDLMVKTMRSKAMDALYSYQLYRLRHGINNFEIGEEYNQMLYGFNYLLFHPWIKSAIKPKYRKTLEKWL
jgi:hypothetical protein